MSSLRFVLLAGAIFASIGFACVATPVQAHVAQVSSSLGCVNTLVTESRAPTGPAMVDGGGMTFADNITPGRGKNLGVYIPPGGAPVARAHQHVRVCLIDIPDKDSNCDPSKDSRGRVFLVINVETDPDYNGQADVYTNAEHGCGGA